jgi:ABC-2 type transport system ATP-binding protein
LFATGTDKQQRIEQVIDQLKIGAYVRRKAKSYSLGMKQKLGIALALLNHPELVILDEPMNGLDPQATRDLRDLILSLAKQGTSFLISSHILSELEKIVQEVVVIDQGKIIKQASIEELAATGKSFIFLKTDNNTQAQQVLTAAGYQVELTAKQLKLEQNDESELAKIIQVLTNQQINILDVQHQHSDLETSLLALLGKDQLQQTKE